MLRSVKLLVIACCFGTVASYAVPVLVTTSAALGPNDSVNWAQLGSPGTILGPGAFAATSVGGKAVSGSFSGLSPKGITAVECPGVGCNWPGGFGAGDSLVWADNGSSIPGSGPLSLSFSALLGAGALIQSDAPEAFHAQISAFNGGSLLGSFSVASDSAGDPLFIGVLDTVAEITSVSFDVTDTSIPHDFAIDTLDLRAAGSATVPEPSALISSLLLVGLLLAARTLLARYRSSSREAKRTVLSLIICAMAVSITLPAFGQSDGTISVNPGDLQVVGEQDARTTLMTAGASGLNASLSSQLAIWTGSVTAYNGSIYNYSMVGQSPFNRGARTTTIDTVVIPLKITIGGFIFDPQATDNGCLGAAGNTAYGLTLGSPIFQNAPYTMNGVNVGTTQYVDAYQRANFWSRVQLTGNSYHTMLNPLTVAEQSLAYASTNSSTSAVATVGGAQCGSSPGPVNQFAKLGIVNINVIDPQLQAIIAGLGLTPSQFPLFIIYKAVISNGAANNLGNCCILGYHNSTTFVVTNPGQTYGISEFDTGTVFTGVHDTDVLAHEVGEWMDDPSGNNRTPLWGGIGQVSGCQGNLEVGDPLSGTEFPPVVLGGFTYHLQELAFFSWYYAGTGPSIAAGGKFSNNGTFGGGAKACPPGGTN